MGIPGFVAYVALWAAFVRTTWRVYTWARDEGTRRLVLGIGAGRLAHQIFFVVSVATIGGQSLSAEAPGFPEWERPSAN